MQLFVSHWEPGHISSCVTKPETSKGALSVRFLSSGSQKIATICAMNLHLLHFNPVNAPRCASSQSPVPNVGCQVLHVAEPYVNRSRTPSKLGQLLQLRVLCMSFHCHCLSSGWLGLARASSSLAIGLYRTCRREVSWADKQPPFPWF